MCACCENIFRSLLLALDELDLLENLGVERMILLQAGELGSCVLSGKGAHDFCELLALVITFDVLEAKSILNTTNQGSHIVATFGELGSRTNESLLATKLAERSTTDTNGNIFKMGIGDTGDDGVDILLLFLRGDAVLATDQMSGFLQSLMDFLSDLFVGHSLMDGLDSLLVGKVGGSGVAGVDGEELTLNVWLKVIDPVNAIDLGMARLEAAGLDTPLVERLNDNIKVGIGRLGGDNSIDGRIAKFGFGTQILENFRLQVLGVGDEGFESIGRVDHVFTSNDCKRLCVGACSNAISNGLGDELEDIGANSAGDNVGVGNLLNDIVHVVFGVDGTVVGNGLALLSILTDFGDLVGLGGVNAVDQVVNNINKDDGITCLVKKLGDEAAANVASTEVNSCANHGCWSVRSRDEERESH